MSASVSIYRDLRLTLRAVPIFVRSLDVHSPDAFREMARDLDPFLYNVALRLCRNAADARDLVQDTFEIGLRHRCRLHAESNLRGWLTTILYRQFLDRCRGRAHEPPPAPLETVADTQLAQEPFATEEAWERVSFEDLLNALERLEEPFQQVYRLAALEHRRLKEISKDLGIPTATVGTRLARARTKLKALLLGSTPEEEVQ